MKWSTRSNQTKLTALFRVPPLDKTKIEAYTGDYYWRARDIQFLLDNCTWSKLYKSILTIEKKTILK